LRTNEQEPIEASFCLPRNTQIQTQMHLHTHTHKHSHTHNCTQTVQGCALLKCYEDEGPALIITPSSLRQQWAIALQQVLVNTSAVRCSIFRGSLESYKEQTCFMYVLRSSSSSSSSRKSVQS
jgi:hypothetical protein